MAPAVKPQGSSSLCENCQSARPVLRRPRDSTLLCRTCFLDVFIEEVHATIMAEDLFKPGERVALGASGGKDSTVLIDVMVALNEKYHYGLELVLVSVDEGIVGYRDDSLKTVERNQQTYQLPLTVLSYQDLYGWTMDRIVEQIGTRSNCTFCGVFRRNALERGAQMVGADKIATGHNADDVAETILMNLLRADAARLQRCASAKTSGDGDGNVSTIPRVKPLKYAYEKEIVLYAYHKQLDYFVTECTYSKEAFRGHARAFIKEIESIRSRSIFDLVRSGEDLQEISNQSSSFNTLDSETPSSSLRSTAPDIPPKQRCIEDSACIRKGSRSQASQTQIESHIRSTTTQAQRCSRCGSMSSHNICRACQLLDSLNRGRARIELVGKSKFSESLGKSERR